jgi:cytochrome c oxidase subunit IV
MKINPKIAIASIIAILAISYVIDYDMFKGLLVWALGGAIVLLMNVAFFGNLIAMVMKNKDVQDLIRLFREAKDRLEKILENQKNGNH